jgi:SulP family sulfate permease
VPEAQLVPLTRILTGEYRFDYGGDYEVVLVCRSGRRSRRAAQQIKAGQAKVRILRGGMLAWEAAGLLEAVEYVESPTAANGQSSASENKSEP